MANASEKKTYEANKKSLKQYKIICAISIILHLFRYLREYNTISIILSVFFCSIDIICILLFIRLATPRFDSAGKLIYGGVNLRSRGICSFILDIFVIVSICLILNIFTTENVFFLTLVPVAQRLVTFIIKIFKPKNKAIEESNAEEDKPSNKERNAKRKAKRGY